MLARGAFVFIFAFLSIIFPPVGASSSPLDNVMARLDTLEKANARLDKENVTLRERLRRLERNARVQSDTPSITHEQQPRNFATDIRVDSSFASTPNVDKRGATVSLKGFSGFYAGAFYGHEFLNEKRYSDPQIQNPTPFYPQDLKGNFVGAFAGYNYIANGLMLGFEARAHYGFQKASFDNYDSEATTDAFFNSHDLGKLEKSFGGDLAARFGFIAMGDWLLYARTGVGLQQFKATSTYEYTWTCITSRCTPSHFVQQQSQKSVTPYITAGLGIEKNFGSYFARIEGELLYYIGRYTCNSPENLSPCQDPNYLINYEPYYTTRLSAGVGYRF